MPQLLPSLPPPLSVTAGQTTVLMKDISEFSAVNGIYSNFFQHRQPARAAFQVSRTQHKLQDIMSPAHRTIKTTCSVYGSVRPVLCITFDFTFPGGGTAQGWRHRDRGSGNHWSVEIRTFANSEFLHVSGAVDVGSVLLNKTYLNNL